MVGADVGGWFAGRGATIAAGATTDRCLEARSSGGGACPRLQSEGPERQELDAPILHWVDGGAEGRHARLLPFGGLVTVLQDAARWAARTGRGDSEAGAGVGGNQLRSARDPCCFCASARDHVSAVVGR